MKRFVLLSDGEVAKEYESIEKVFEDIYFKDPATFHIGDRRTMRIYTLSKFEEIFGEDKDD